MFLYVLAPDCYIADYKMTFLSHFCLVLGLIISVSMFFQND